MIVLMTPGGFARLMGTMWPELLDAMPLGMGKMMRVTGRIPGSLEIMKPIFPILFPKLLPMMMSGVMPAMLERVARTVPMPDYKREQMSHAASLISPGTSTIWSDHPLQYPTTETGGEFLLSRTVDTILTNELK
jgi:hypothetical protein